MKVVSTELWCTSVPRIHWSFCLITPAALADVSPTASHHCASVKKATFKMRWLRASESGLKENRYDDEEA